MGKMLGTFRAQDHIGVDLAAKTLVAVLLATSVLLGGSPTYAVDPQPHTDWNYYVETTNGSTLYGIGCNWANYDITYGVNSLIVLDFGGQTTDGSATQEINGVNITNFQVRDLSQEVALGYHNCGGSNHAVSLQIAVGTNNSKVPASGYSYQSYGTTWANAIVQPIKNWVRGSTCCEISVVAANDIESWGGGGPGVNATGDWAYAYSGTGVSIYYNYGSANGCPTNRYDNLVGCSDGSAVGWAQASYYYLSWGIPAAYAMPEIYNYPLELQWAMISKYGQVYQPSLGAISFTGPMDDKALDGRSFIYTPAQAWSNFWNALNNNGLPTLMYDENEFHIAA